MLAAAGLDSADAYAHHGGLEVPSAPIDPVVPNNMAPDHHAQSAFLITDTLDHRHHWGGNGYCNVVPAGGQPVTSSVTTSRARRGPPTNPGMPGLSGYTPNLVATWIGFDNHQRGLGRAGFGGGAAQPIWIDFMKTALQQVPERRCRSPKGSCRSASIVKPVC